MSSSTFVHAIVFAAGAIVGGGLVSVAGRKAQPTPVHLPASGSPIIRVESSGKATISASIGALSPVLKYGNPGTTQDCQF